MTLIPFSACYRSLRSSTVVCNSLRRKMDIESVLATRPLRRSRNLTWYSNLLTVSALDESLLALSKHLVNRIDTIWAARQQALKLSALASTPEADPATLRVLQRRYYKPLVPPRRYPPRSFMPSGSVMSQAFTRPGRMRTPRLSAFSRISRDSPLVKKRRPTWP